MRMGLAQLAASPPAGCLSVPSRGGTPWRPGPRVWAPHGTDFNAACRRRPAASAGGGRAVQAAWQGRDAESSLRTTVELDKLIDSLRDADSTQLPKLVAENILSFDQNFWMRVATRAETCSSPEDKGDLEQMCGTVMRLVELVVRRTEEQMDLTSDSLADLLRLAAEGERVAAGELLGGEAVGEGEIVWPPRDPQAITRLQKEVERWDQEGKLDDRFLASLTAQLRQASEKGDRPGLVAMLQKVLQLYAATRFARWSFAHKDDGSLDSAESLLEGILQGATEDWAPQLQRGLALGGGTVSEADFFRVLELRAQRMLMRTESGSYEQRILGEYLLEVETRAHLVVEAFQHQGA